METFYSVQIAYNGIIPALGVRGPLRNVQLSESQVKACLDSGVELFNPANGQPFQFPNPDQVAAATKAEAKKATPAPAPVAPAPAPKPPVAPPPPPAPPVTKEPEPVVEPEKPVETPVEKLVEEAPVESSEAPEAVEEEVPGDDPETPSADENSAEKPFWMSEVTGYEEASNNRQRKVRKLASSALTEAGVTTFEQLSEEQRAKLVKDIQELLDRPTQ